MKTHPWLVLVGVFAVATAAVIPLARQGRGTGARHVFETAAHRDG
jgi:hypothetical protein